MYKFIIDFSFKTIDIIIIIIAYYWLYHFNSITEWHLVCKILLKMFITHIIDLKYGTLPFSHRRIHKIVDHNVFI